MQLASICGAHAIWVSETKLCGPSDLVALRASLNTWPSESRMPHWFRFKTVSVCPSPDPDGPNFDVANGYVP